MHQLTGWAIDHRVGLDELELTRPSLEDMYLLLTGAPPGDARRLFDWTDVVVVGGRGLAGFVFAIRFFRWAPRRD
jgi:hypothetical protein